MGFLHALFTNNFSLIAENIATIYRIIKLNDSCSHWTEDQCLYAAGIIDLNHYIFGKGLIKFDDVSFAVLLAETGYCSLNAHSVHHQSVFFRNDPHDLLTSFAMQIECLIFSCDTNVSPYKIIELVIANKEKISKAVQKAMSASMKKVASSNFMPVVLAAASSPDFQNTISDFSLDNH